MARRETSQSTDSSGSGDEPKKPKAKPDREGVVQKQCLRSLKTLGTAKARRRVINYLQDRMNEGVEVEGFSLAPPVQTV